jgi:hypothetical protein
MLESNQTCKIAKHSRVYVARLMRSREEGNYGYKLGLAKPCSHCEQMLRLYGVRWVCYTDCIDNVSVLVEIELL